MRKFWKKKRKEDVDLRVTYRYRPSQIPIKIKEVKLSSFISSVKSGSYDGGVYFHRDDEVNIFYVISHVLYIDNPISSAEALYLGKYLPSSVSKIKVEHFPSKLDKLLMNNKYITEIDYKLYKKSNGAQLNCFYRFVYLTTFTVISLDSENSTSLTLKERTLFTRVSYLPNLKQVTRLATKRYQQNNQIFLNLMFNNCDISTRSNWFILHSMVYGDKVCLAYIPGHNHYQGQEGQEDLSVQKYWLSQMKMNKCLSKITATKEMFKTDIFRLNEFD